MGGPSAPYAQSERGDWYDGPLPAARVRGTGLSVLLHAGGTGAVPQAPADGGQASALCRHVQVPLRRGARRADRERIEADAALRGAEGRDHRVRRSRARAAEVRVERHRRLHHPARGRYVRVLLLQRRRRLGDGRHARAARRRPSHQHAAAADAARCAGTAPAGLRTRRPAGGCGRSAAVQAARQHQRAGIPRARVSSGRAPQSSVPSGPHGRRRGLAAARATCRRISARSISAGLRRASRRRSSCTGRRRRCSACRPPTSAPGSASPDAADFVELVRHNVVLPADAAPWIAVVRGELPPLGPEERRIVAAAGPEFFAAAAQALDESGADFAALAETSEGAHGTQGGRALHAAAGGAHRQTHGPELAPLLKLMPRETARRRLRDSCSQSIIRSPAEKAEFKPLQRRRSAHVRLRHHRVRLHPHRPCAHAHGLRPGAAVPALARPEGHLCPQHHRHRRQDHSARGGERRGLGRARAPLHGRDARGLRAARARAAGHRAARHRVHPRDHRDDADA